MFNIVPSHYGTATEPLGSTAKYSTPLLGFEALGLDKTGLPNHAIVGLSFTKPSAPSGCNTSLEIVLINSVSHTMPEPFARAISIAITTGSKRYG